MNFLLVRITVRRPRAGMCRHFQLSFPVGTYKISFIFFSLVGTCLSLRDVAHIANNDQGEVAGRVYETPWDAKCVCQINM